MKNKKKILLLLTSASTIGVVLSVTAVSKSTFNHPVAAEIPNSMNCNYFFDDTNGYTSIYELNQMFINNTFVSDAQYKTWGTITKSWTYNSRVYANIQSTDKNGKVSATSLYDCISNVSDYPIGSVVEVSLCGGNLSSFNGSPLITPISQKPVSVSKLYGSNPDPVETWDINDYWWQSSNNFEEFCSYGVRQVRLKIVKITNQPMDNSAVATYAQSSLLIDYTNSENASTIQGTLNAAKMQNRYLDIVGYLYSYNVNGTTSKRLFVRDWTDISNH